MDKKEIEELLAFRERQRKINRLKATRAREKKAEAGLKQVNIWATETEADLVRRFLKFIRAGHPAWKLSNLAADGKWYCSYKFPPDKT